MKISTFHLLPKTKKFNRKHYIQVHKDHAAWYTVWQPVKRIFPGLWKEVEGIRTQSLYGGKLV